VKPFHPNQEKKLRNKPNDQQKKKKLTWGLGRWGWKLAVWCAWYGDLNTGMGWDER